MSSKKKSKIIKMTEVGIEGEQIEEYDDPSAFSLLSFSNSTNIKIISKTKDEIVFDITGIDPPIANSIRRILLAEVPTMAIENVKIFQNTSVIPDEVLSHRLGLIPILADANDFEYKKENEDFNENNSITFHLKVKCYKNDKGEIINESIFSNQIIFIPKGDQENKFSEDNLIKPVYDDILINKLRPGQEIDAELIAVKGIGRTHAKWSPVCTAYYKLLNNITFNETIQGDDAKELKSLCPMGVFEIKQNKIVVGDIRKCTTCRECIRNQKYGKLVNLGKVSDHYEFHVESVGIYEPESIVFRAFKVLKEKCELWTGIFMEKLGENNN